MAASTSGALKAFLEAQNLNISVYRDQAPANTKPPYLSVDEAVAIVPDKLQDGAASTVREHVTVHLWMAWKDLPGMFGFVTGSGALLESLTLPGAVVKALEGSRLQQSGSGVPPTTVYGVKVMSAGPRMLEIDDNVVHVPIWIEIWRAL